MKPTHALMQPRLVLGIAAHADDLDFGMAGAAAMWAAQGAEVWYLVLTCGSKGVADASSVDGAVAIRRQEQQSAADILGIAGVIFLDYEDGALENSAALRRDIARTIRKLCPDVVVTFDPSALYFAGLGLINHPDHRAAGQAALDAVYPVARNAHSFPELLDESLPPHCVTTVLLINFDHPTYRVDITAAFDKKLQALAAHASQETSLAPFVPLLTSLAEETGEQAGCQYAEGFIRLDVV
jgi:LmbE family N-acetylglucosaminyl deacetylase